MYTNSAVGSQTGAPAAAPLATPTFALTPGPGSLTLNSFSAVPHASSYSAQLCDSAGNTCQAAVTVLTTGHVFTGLVGGTTYTIRLTAIGDGTAYASSVPGSRSATTGPITVAPTATISGSNTQLNGAAYVAIAPDGTIAVGDTPSPNGSVSIFSPGSTGNVTPSAVLDPCSVEGAGTPAAHCWLGSVNTALAFDSSGTLYVSQTEGYTGAAILDYPETGSGYGPSFGTFGAGGYAGGLTVTPSGAIYCTSVGYGYPGIGVGSVAAGGVTSSFNSPTSGNEQNYGELASDANNNFYAVQGAGVVEFAAGTTNVVRTLAGPNTGLTSPGQIAVDSGGRLYVENGAGISIFASGASGNVAPIAVVDATGGIAIGPDDSLYVAAGSAVEIFAPLFAP